MTTKTTAYEQATSQKPRTYIGGDLWEQVAAEKAASGDSDDAGLLRGRTAAAKLEFQRLLSEAGHQMDTGQVSIWKVSGSHMDDIVMIYQGCRFRVGGYPGNYHLLALRDGWPRWREIKRLADLAG